ncbi:NAD-dependent histone deacetylase sir2 [Dissophora globulifera]|nr:NAD-dependent histone deacetylase sir2 [Dissophora globulifera]
MSPPTSQHSPLLITTDRTSLASSSEPTLAHPPESPLNRKRTDATDQDHPPGNDDTHAESSHHSSLPPLKKTKTSVPVSQVSLTAYRSSQEVVGEEVAEEPLSEPSSPATSTSPSIAPNTVIMPSVGSSRAVLPVIPFLTRSSTLEEIVPSLSSSFDNSADPWIEGLSLDAETDITPVRASGVERIMGVSTSSRQSSPALSLPDTATCGPGPMNIDERTPRSADQSSRRSSSHLDSPEDLARGGTPDAMLLDVEESYDEEADDDYELSADTTVDENYNRLDTSSSEDDDSFSDIDVHNIASLDYGDSPIQSYHDMDPLCTDRLTEEEQRKIMDEAREFGIGHIIQEYIMTGIHSVKKLLLMTSPGEIKIPSHFTENDLISLFVQRLERELRRRQRLSHIHTIDHVVDLLKQSKNIMVLTGAGVSVSCGIPDFRSSDGIYSRLSEFELDDPTQMFELDFFLRKPQVFYSFAREIFPSNFTPSPSHHFIKLLEDQGKLLRNYTQNIDTLEQKAGIQRILQCHVPGNDIKDAILNKEIAYCTVCQMSSTSPNAQNRADDRRYDDSDSDSDSDSDDDDDNRRLAVMKPDIVFFGERLPSAFDENLEQDRSKVDLLIVIGSSLKVAPVSDIMHQLPKGTPQILINRTPITHMEFDVQLLGNCDTIVAELCRMSGWELKHEKLPGGTSNVPGLDLNTNADGRGKGGRARWSVIEPNTYLFEGAILGDVEYESSQTPGRKKRGRFENEGVEGYDADNDGDSEELRRRSFGGGDRRSSLGIGFADSGSDTDSDSDDQSDGSQRTIRGLLSGVSSGIGVNRSFLSPEPTWITPAGFARGTTLPRSGSIPEIHLPHAAAVKTVAGDMEQEEDTVKDDDNEEQDIGMRIVYTETMPLDLDAETVHAEVERRMSEDLERIVEDPQMEQEQSQAQEKQRGGLEFKEMVMLQAPEASNPGAQVSVGPAATTRPNKSG